MGENRKRFSKEEILKGLRLLSDLAAKAKKTVEITVYGGSAMVIGFQSRVSTRDVDATVKGDPAFVREAARRVAPEEGGVRVILASPQYLLAMKCMAMRANTTGHQGDIADIRELVKITRMQSVDQVLRLVESFYPARQIQPKVAFGLEEIFQDMAGDGGSK